jgi:inosine-uridine nucleoside N-ribohydrolase
MRTARCVASPVIASSLLLNVGCTPPKPAVTVVPAGLQSIVIDTDLDLSDIAAVATLLGDPGVDVKAVTLTPNGTGPSDCADLERLGRWVLERLQREHVPLACGRKLEGTGPMAFPAEWHAGAERLWGMELPEPLLGTPVASAAELLTTTAAAGPVLLVALGPWTNLRDALDLDPSFPEGLVAIHAMAGSVEADGNVQVGSVTYADRLEWNAVLDSAAFREVFASDIPLRLVPLDATDDVPVPGDLLERLADASGTGAQLISELLQRAPERLSGAGQQLWDELAALAVTNAEVVRWEQWTLSVASDTRLLADGSGRRVTVAVEGHRAQAVDALVAGLRGR